jgi:hypothetical protein
LDLKAERGLLGEIAVHHSSYGHSQHDSNYFHGMQLSHLHSWVKLHKFEELRNEEAGGELSFNEPTF